MSAERQERIQIPKPANSALSSADASIIVSPAGKRWLPADGLVALGPMGVYVYIAGLALPFASDIPLMALGACSLAVVARSSSQPPVRSPLALPVLMFLGAAGLSIVLSKDLWRSASLSAPLPAGALVFFLIAGTFRSIRHTQLLYLVWAIVGLSLACLLLWAAATQGWVLAHNRISGAGSPILVEANDVVLLALIAPMSIALIAGRSAIGVRILAAVSESRSASQLFRIVEWCSVARALERLGQRSGTPCTPRYTR